MMMTGSKMAPLDVAGMGQPQREQLSLLVILVGLFITLAISVAGVTPFNYVVRGLGAVLAIAYFFYVLRAKSQVCPEMFLYFIWAGWALLGVYVSINTHLFVTRWLTVFQMCIMLLILGGFTNSRRTLSVSLGFLLVGVAIAGGASVVGGSFRRGLADVERIEAVGLGPNAFGRLAVAGMVGLAYFWMLPSRRGRWKHLALLAVMGALGVLVVFSGSRFSFGGYVLFIGLWAWFCYRGKMLRDPRGFLAVLLILVLAGGGIYFLASRALIGERLGQTFDWVFRGGDPGAGGSIRIELHRLALKLLMERPLFGVGLYNFRAYSWMGKTSHSDYTEIFTGTGFLGGFLHLSIYLVLWLRAGKIMRHTNDLMTKQTCGLIRAFEITFLMLGFGQPNFANKFVWILMALFIGYTTAVWNRLRAEVAPAGGHVSGVVPGPGRRPNGMLASPGPGLAVCDEGHARLGPL
jgi:O-antigen ligase